MSSPIIPLTPEQTATQEAQAKEEPYVERAAVAVDKAIETVVFDGPPDVTMSEAAGVAAVKDKGFEGEVGKLVSEGLDLFQKDHGAKATAGGNAQAEEAIEYGDQSGLINEGK